MSDGPSSSRTGAGNDNTTHDEKKSVSGGSFFADLLMGLRFYSRLPTGDHPHESPEISRMAMALPFASLIIGIGPALVLLFGTIIGLPPLFAAALAVASSVVVTGAMAEDGIADAVDGLFGGTTIERRLDILKDSRHGTYGVSALVLFLVLRVSALASMAAILPLAAAAIWLATSIIARSGALWLTLKLPPARRDGAASTAGRVRKVPFLIGLGFAAGISAILAAPFAGIIGIVVAGVLMVIIAFGWASLCKRLLGGQTGDLIGALQALLEIAALSAFIILVGSP